MSYADQVTLEFQRRHLAELLALLPQDQQDRFRTWTPEGVDDEFLKPAIDLLHRSIVRPEAVEVQK